MADAEYWYSGSNSAADDDITVTSGTYQGITRSTEPMWRAIPIAPPATQEQYNALWNRAAQTITFSGLGIQTDPTIAANQMYWASSTPGQFIKFSPPEPAYDPFTDPLMRLPEGM